MEGVRGYVNDNVQFLLLDTIGKKGRAIFVCTLIAIGYVALLYVPALLLPRSKSVREHMLRRFACAGVASLLSPLICLKVLPVETSWRSDYVALLKIFGVSVTHLWQVAVLPTILTASLYLGPLLLDLIEFIEWCIDDFQVSGQRKLLVQHVWSSIVFNGKMLTSDVLWWRNFLVAPISEELVFRACLVPLLLCGGFSPPAVVFLCPMFFALAHTHHFCELVYGQQHDISAAAAVVGMQLGYTTVFGWYATFLYLRTGNLIAPLVAHMFCNSMGLPNIGAATVSSHWRGVFLAYLVGLIVFITFLGPISNPAIYNESLDGKDCSCWLGYCKWSSHTRGG